MISIRDRRRACSRLPATPASELPGNALIRIVRACGESGPTVPKSSACTFAVPSMDGGGSRAAHGLYRLNGFVEIGPYAESEIPDEYKPYWVFMERTLA